MYHFPKIQEKSSVIDFLPDVIRNINNSLITKLHIKKPEYTRFGRTKIKILRIEGVIYEVFGGYGFENILNDNQLKNIHDNNISTSDIDIKILFIKNYKDDFLSDILNSIKTNILEIKGIGNLKYIKMGKLSYGFASKYVDVIIGNLNEYSALTYFFSNNDIRDLSKNWISNYSLYSAIHMFLLLYKILYVSPTDCNNDKKRIPKIRKIFGRICIFYNEPIPSDIITNRKLHFLLLKKIKSNHNSYFCQISKYMNVEFQNLKPMEPEEFLKPQSLLLPRIGKQNGGYNYDSEIEESESEIEESESETEESKSEIVFFSDCPKLNYEENREIFGKEECEEKNDLVPQNGSGVIVKEHYPLYKSTIFILSGFVLFFSTLSKT